MDKLNYLNKYNELVQITSEKEAKLESFVQNWLDGNYLYSLNDAEQTIIQMNEQIKQLQSDAQKNRIKFEIISKEEKLNQEQLQSSNTYKSILKNSLVVDKNFIDIFDLLSFNENCLDLIGECETLEEIELNKQIALSSLREKVINNEISLVEASKLKQNIEKTFNSSMEFFVNMKK